MVSYFTRATRIRFTQITWITRLRDTQFMGSAGSGLPGSKLGYPDQICTLPEASTVAACLSRRDSLLAIGTRSIDRLPWLARRDAKSFVCRSKTKIGF